MTRSPEPTANLVSEGDHRTHVAARLMRRRTKVGLYPVGDGSQTKALRSSGNVRRDGQVREDFGGGVGSDKTYLENKTQCGRFWAQCRR